MGRFHEPLGNGWSGRMSNRFFLFGAGYSGRAFARLVASEAYVAGTTRSPQTWSSP